MESIIDWTSHAMLNPQTCSAFRTNQHPTYSHEYVSYIVRTKFCTLSTYKLLQIFPPITSCLVQLQLLPKHCYSFGNSLGIFSTTRLNTSGTKKCRSKQKMGNYGRYPTIYLYQVLPYFCLILPKSSILKLSSKVNWQEKRGKSINLDIRSKHTNAHITL